MEASVFKHHNMKFKWTSLVYVFRHLIYAFKLKHGFPTGDFPKVTSRRQEH